MIHGVMKIHLEISPLITLIMSKGITLFELAYDFDNDGGRTKNNDTMAAQLERVTNIQTSKTISVNIGERSSIVLAVAGYDAVGYGLNVTNVIHVDVTPPDFESGTFKKDVDSSDPESVPFASE